MGSQPQVPDPGNAYAPAAAVASTQQGSYNTPVGLGNQAGSNYNSNTAYGSTNYAQTGVGANGVPIYTATQTLSPGQQQLYNLLTGTQTTAGTQAGNLLSGANYGSMTPQQAIGNETSGIMGQIMGQETGYLAPFFSQQTEQLDAQLRNQGFAPGQPGYDNAMQNMLKSQGATVTNYEAQTAPTILSEAQQMYTLPAQLSESLGGFAAPQAPQQIGGSALNIQPANFQGADANMMQQQMQAYQAQEAANSNMMSGLFGIPTAVLGGWAKSGGLSPFMAAI